MARSNAFYATQGQERTALVSLAARSNRRGRVKLACHLGALLATGALVRSARSSPWLLATMLLHGIILVFLFAPLHESIH